MSMPVTEAGKGPFGRAFYSFGAHSATGTELTGGPSPLCTSGDTTHQCCLLSEVPTDIGTNDSANKHKYCQAFPKPLSPRKGCELDCGLRCPCVVTAGVSWLFTALELVSSISHTRSADWQGATVIAEPLLAAEMSKLPVCAGDKHDAAPNVFQHCLCDAGNYWQTAPNHAIQVRPVCTSCCNAFHPFTTSVSFQTDANQLLQGCFFQRVFWCEHLFLVLHMKKQICSSAWSASFPILQSSK